VSPRPSNPPAPSLKDYQLEVTTVQTFSLDAEDTDIFADYARGVSARVLKLDEGQTEPLVVGTASGTLFLGSLAAREGIPLRELLDAHDGDLVAMFDVFNEPGSPIVDQDLLYVEEMAVEPQHELTRTRAAIVDQLLRTAGSGVERAFTWQELFNLPDGSDEEQAEHSPDCCFTYLDEGMMMVLRLDSH